MKNKKLRQEPNMFFETAIPASALISGSKFIYDIGKDGRKVYQSTKPHKPLLISVLGSMSTEHKHELIIEIENTGMHGVYIESIAALDPKQTSIRYFDHNLYGNEISLFEPIKKDSALGNPDVSGRTERTTVPIFMPRSQKLTLRVELDRFDNDRLDKKPFGKFCINYTVAGVAKTDLKASVEYSVRP
ncbi:hypothetical protein [Vibrio sp. HN007]|uniref:hypothetical protein n=1 Tax=Vibrio iocasae TaxID=3098914 RepID=UPI0035D4816F